MRLSLERAARLAFAAAVLAALSLPASALGQEDAPTLKEAPGSAYPDRQYRLRLPSPRALEPGDVTVTENHDPVGGQVGVEALGGGTEEIGTRLSSEYLVTYRSLLPSKVRAEVRASVEGLPAATASYTTPELVIVPRDTFEQSRVDRIIASPFLVVVVVAVLALLVVARARLE